MGFFIVPKLDTKLCRKKNIKKSLCAGFFFSKPAYIYKKSMMCARGVLRGAPLGRICKSTAIKGKNNTFSLAGKYIYLRFEAGGNKGRAPICLSLFFTETVKKNGLCRKNVSSIYKGILVFTKKKRRSKYQKKCQMQCSKNE